MAGKAELPAVQNVVVYVSNENFGQAYAVGQPQNGPPPQPPPQPPHPKKTATPAECGYFLNYQSNGALKNYHNGCSPLQNNDEATTVDEQQPPPQPPQTGYVTVLGDVRCDSVRSEAAESSCSSLSSADDNLLVVQQPPNDMLLYDPSVSVRPGGGVLLTTTANVPPPPQQPAVFVPNGWKRIVNNNAVFYISPSNAALSYPEQVKEYLLSSGTCKCGLECHFNFDNVFNFDPKVIGKPWVFSPDTNPGDLTKLCNHKRKTLEIAALDCKPPDHNIKLRKEYNVKKKRRKIGLPYAGGVSVSQILAHREKLQQQQQPQIQQQQQQFVKDPQQQQQQPQIWPQSNVTSTQMVSNRLQGYPEQQFIRCQDQSGNRVLAGSPMIMSGDGTMMVPPSPSNTSPNIHIQQHQVITPNGQLIGVPPNNPMVPQQLQQHRIFVNGQPNEPSGPGRPNIQMIPVSLAGQGQQRPQYNLQYNQNPQYQHQYDPSKNIRPFGGQQILNGFRPQQPQKIGHWARQQQPQLQQQIPVPQQQQSPNNIQNVYERVPPLHQPQTVWQEEIKRKKIKLAKMSNKNRAPYIMEGCSPNHSPCPNIDVRQIPGENGRAVVSQTNQPSSSPSFMEDPSGYLAQQTALLNNTINRQTGAFTMQNAAPNIIAISQGNEVPLPSNVVHQMKMQQPPQQQQQQHIMARCNQNQMKPVPVPQHIVLNQQQYNHMIQQQQQNVQNVADSSAIHDQYNNQCHGCLHQSRVNGDEDPVISSTNEGLPDSRPIQGGTVSTSNVSPIDGGPPTPPFHGREAVSVVPVKANVVTTMASGRTVGSNTITSVLAGRANTATVSVNTPPSIVNNNNSPSPQIPQAITVNVSKSPLEMVQSVVSSIQVPPAQQMSPQIIKHSPTGLPAGHILVSSGGQLIMASTGNGGGVMPPPPPKLMANQTAMPPISVSPMITNVTASVTQVIPAVAQQVLGQQTTVLVNALPTPFVLQPGVTMTMDGMTVGQNMQLPQLLTGNVIHQQQQQQQQQQQAQTALLSPETKKKTKKRKLPSQTVANMLHIAAAQQNQNVMMSQPTFPQQIQMAHSPQTTPVMQALTILPSKTGGPPQIVMNGQQQLQPAQQINLLQPVNLNFPIQQFIVPNLGVGGSMVMNADGTATILQDAGNLSNLGMQLQIQNVNGQNVLTPVQSNGIFNGGQNILAAGPAGMVIRAPTSQGKIIQQQQHSPGAQFLSPNGGQFVVNGAQFSGQLSPLVASVSPSQQMTFSTSPQQIRTSQAIQPQQQEYIQCNQMGQTLMVPCTPATNIASSSSNQQNTTYVQQNTTIVQQQTTMVSNNQQLNNFQSPSQQQQQQPAQNHPNVARTTTVNLDQNFIISSNDNKQQQLQAVVLQSRDGPTQNPNYRQSVSTQTAVNQNAQAVTTNTFCQTSTISAGSPPDTTTLSPLASGGQSPPTADTTTHSGSTDDGLSPAPSTCSDINVQGRHQSMAMVHCISSSEPDSADLNNQPMEHDWRRTQPMCSTPEITFAKKTTPSHVAYAESSTLMSGLQFFTEQMKQEVVSSRNYEKAMKRNSSDTMVIMESHTHSHSHMFEDDEDGSKGSLESEREREFALGDLVWGPSRGFPAWPGKVVRVGDGDGECGTVTVKWFGTENPNTSNVHVNNLQTLSEGLDAHHRARNKARTSRKLNGQLEAAIQEAMTELDNPDPETKVPQRPLTTTNKKTSGRLRSSQR